MGRVSGDNDGSSRQPNIPSQKALQTKPLSLREIQDCFQRAIVEGGDQILALIPGNSKTNADVLFGVYRHAYRARLRDVIASDHEFLKTYLGDDGFEEMANAYIGAYPSRTTNARWFSSSLPEFLAQTAPYSSRAELAELAALVRALANAFDAADDPVVEISALQAFAPSDWAGLRFSPHGSVQRLNFTTNAFEIWKALKDEAQVPPVESLACPARLIVWRDDFNSRVRRLADEEAMMWDEAANGVAFGRLCELAATIDDPETAAIRAAQNLQGWITSGMLQGASGATDETLEHRPIIRTHAQDANAARRIVLEARLQHDAPRTRRPEGREE